ncbi:MAG: amidohydrolase, partial [Pseudonocardiales bacterium]
MSLRAEASALQDELAHLRRTLHGIPEVGLLLPQTQQAVLQALDGLPLEISTGHDVSSVVGILRGGRTGGGPLVLLRGDMDGLPVAERTGLEFASENGAMHACGHDLHTAGLVGAARLLAARQHDLAGDVLFMFQPGEEGFDGAGAMLGEGLLEAAGRRPDAAYGLHVASAGTKRGVFTARPGTLMAASDDLRVRVVGAGGHGSQPHNSKDPIPAAAEIVLAIEAAAREEPAETVATVGTLAVVPGAVSVIPGQTRLGVDLRSVETASLTRLEAAVRERVAQIAQARGVGAEVALTRAGEPTELDPSLATEALEAARRLGIGASETWSGAGHDAQHLSALAPALLLFVPLHGGESHTPQEGADLDEIVQASR